MVEALVYEYTCCERVWDVVKPLADFDRPEACPTCHKPARRLISRTNIMGASDWDTAQFCPGLGQVVKSNKERRMIAKARGLEEVGTENMTKLSKEWASERRKKADERIEQAAVEAYNHGLKQA